MPSFHRVPMFFSSWAILRRRRAAGLGEEAVEDGGDDEDQLQLLDGWKQQQPQPLQQQRGRPRRSAPAAPHQRDRLSVTEEDDDDFDSSSSVGGGDLSRVRPPQNSHSPATTATTTTTVAVSTTPTAAAIAASTKPRRWHRALACKARQQGYRYQTEIEGHDERSGLPDAPEEESAGSGGDDDDESTSPQRGVGSRLDVIPFVSLHLHDDRGRRRRDRSSFHLVDGDGDEASATSEVDEHFWQSTLEKAAQDNDEQLRGGTCDTTPASPLPSPRPPSAPQSTASSSPPVPSRQNNLPAPSHSPWHAVPSEIAVELDPDVDPAATPPILWDPARPLLCDGEDWDLHALQADIDSDFATGCQALKSILHQGAVHPLSRNDEEAFLNLISQYPDLCLVRYRDNDQHQSHQYPLHWCCRRGWIQGVKACYSAAPEVIGFAVSSMLPLHLALSQQQPPPPPPATQEDALPEIVEFLCQRYPAALKHTNALHQTPLHLAVLSQADVRSVSSLLWRYPTAAQLADARGYTPTHYACQDTTGRHGEVLRLLLQDSPCVAATVTSRLERPLHVAAKHNAAELIGILLEDTYHPLRALAPPFPPPLESDRAPRRLASPSPASCTDSRRCTPLHYLAAHGDKADAAALRLLVEACPSAKYATDEDGCTPYELAVRAHATPGLLSALQ